MLVTRNCVTTTTRIPSFIAGPGRFPGNPLRRRGGVVDGGGGSRGCTPATYGEHAREPRKVPRWAALGLRNRHWPSLAQHLRVVYWLVVLNKPTGDTKTGETRARFLGVLSRRYFPIRRVIRVNQAIVNWRSAGENGSADFVWLHKTRSRKQDR